MYIWLSDSEYWKINKKYDLRSLLGLSYYWSVILLILWFIVDSFLNAPVWVTNLRLITISIPVIITLISIIIITLHWFIFLLSRLLKLNYENSLMSHWIEWILGSIFPRKIYRNKLRNTLYLRTSKKKTIYYWVLMNIVILIIIGIWFIFIRFPYITTLVNENTTILRNIIDIDRLQYQIKILNF